jgi:hypothetical protein
MARMYVRLVQKRSMLQAASESATGQKQPFDPAMGYFRLTAGSGHRLRLPEGP